MDTLNTWASCDMQIRGWVHPVAAFKKSPKGVPLQWCGLVPRLLCCLHASSQDGAGSSLSQARLIHTGNRGDQQQPFNVVARLHGSCSSALTPVCVKALQLVAESPEREQKHCTSCNQNMWETNQTVLHSCVASMASAWQGWGICVYNDMCSTAPSSLSPGKSSLPDAEVAMPAQGRAFAGMAIPAQGRAFCRSTKAGCCQAHVHQMLETACNG